MNVNELADKLDSISYECTLEEWRESPVGTAAVMLRQQQAEIEALKEQVVAWEKAAMDCRIKLELSQCTRYFDNAQIVPYAYAVVQGKDGMENVSLQFDHPEMCGQTYIQAIPLFNHQTKKENQ